MSEFIDAVACMGWRRPVGVEGKARQSQQDFLATVFLDQFAYVAVASDGGKPEEPFNRSRAKNNAARVAGTYTDDPVLVFTDADTYVPRAQVQMAVDVVGQRQAEICLAHDGVALYLSEGILRGNGRGGIATPFPGGIFAMRYSTFWSIGGFDEAFVGWGHEDICLMHSAAAIFGMRIATLGTREEGPSPLYKLDLLHSRVNHEARLASSEGMESVLYQQNTRRRDAYFALPESDPEAYWGLRNHNHEEPPC